MLDSLVSVDIIENDGYLFDFKLISAVFDTPLIVHGWGLYGGKKLLIKNLHGCLSPTC